MSSNLYIFSGGNLAIFIKKLVFFNRIIPPIKVDLRGKPAYIYSVLILSLLLFHISTPLKSEYSSPSCPRQG